MAALTQYWIDYFIKKGDIDNKLTAARFQILLAFKLLNQSEGMPAVSSNKATKWALSLIDKLLTERSALANLKNAIKLVSTLLEAKTNKRDAVRSASFTAEVIKQVQKINSTKRVATTKKPVLK